MENKEQQRKLTKSQLLQFENEALYLRIAELENKEQAPAKETVEQAIHRLINCPFPSDEKNFKLGAFWKDQQWISKIQQRKAELEREKAKLNENIKSYSDHRFFRIMERINISINELDLLLKIGE